MRFNTLDQWLAWQETLHPNKIDLGLDRVVSVLRRMGLDQPNYVVITIAGTNGKGSCVAMLESILLTAGYRVGAYLSPHLMRYNERIRVLSQQACGDALCASFNQIDESRGDISLTYFEFGTLAALDIFSRANLDVAILEVGMGGRLDAVNSIDADVALVTNIGIDHVAWLGSDRNTIAVEKAGIFRSEHPAIFGDRDVPDSLLEYAKSNHVPLYRLGHEYNYSANTKEWSWRGINRQRPALVYPALRGPHQLNNASSVIMALELLSDRLPVTQQDIRHGLIDVKLPGRFQVVPGPIQQVFDVAHNPLGAKVLAESLRQQLCTGRTYAVVSMLSDKDIKNTTYSTIYTC